MPKFFKLGDRAEQFYDPVTKVQILKGAVIKMNDKEQSTKRAKKAIQGGHIIHSSKEEYDRYMKSIKAKEEVSASYDDDDVDNTLHPETNDPLPEGLLSDMTKDQMLDWAVENELIDEDEERKAFKKKKNSEILDELVELYNDDEDDDDEDED